MRTHRNSRGSALVETVLVTPVLLAVTGYCIYLAEVVHVKLELQQAARFAVWESTAHGLSDALQGASTAAFTEAEQRIRPDTEARFRQLGAGASARATSWVLDVSAPTVALSNNRAELDLQALPPVAAEGPGFALIAAALSRRPVLGVLQGAGFNLDGRVDAVVRSQVRSRLVGLPALDALTLEQHATLIADSWALADGADARVAHGRAGVHASGTDHGLRAQVSRLVFAGGAAIPPSAISGALTQAVPLPLPSLTGTFVVSHNYGPRAGKAVCPGIPGYPSGLGTPDARGGLSDLSARSDHDRPVCFDTAPFRDTEAYAESLSARQFAGRGAFFLGCPHAQADDPAQPKDVDVTDRNGLKAHCEDGP